MLITVDQEIGEVIYWGHQRNKNEAVDEIAALLELQMKFTKFSTEVHQWFVKENPRNKVWKEYQNNKLKPNISNEFIEVDLTNNKIIIIVNTKDRIRLEELDTLINQIKTEELQAIQNSDQRSMMRVYSTSNFQFERMKRCDICYEEYEISQFFSLNNCDHQICNSCIYDIVDAALDDYTKIPVKCPICQKSIALADIQNIFKETGNLIMYQDFQSKSIKNFLIQNQEQIICCPSVQCQNFIYQGLIQNNRYDCDYCGFSYCSVCLEYFHQNTQCEDNKDKLEFFQMGIKQCPKCGCFIQKNGGCNHLTCSTCQIHICWECGKYYTDQKDVYKCIEQHQNDEQFPNFPR